MTTTEPINLDAIGQRVARARACVEGISEPDEYECDEQALRTLVTEDVDQLLLELEQGRGQPNYNAGYVDGLRKAVGWLRWLAKGSESAGLDSATMRRLVDGAEAMVASASERLGVEVASPAAVDSGSEG
jgi:hypothetical protein